jgi:hypothetical protein
LSFATPALLRQCFRGANVVYEPVFVLHTQNPHTLSLQNLMACLTFFAILVFFVYEGVGQDAAASRADVVGNLLFKEEVVMMIILV